MGYMVLGGFILVSLAPFRAYYCRDPDLIPVNDRDSSSNFPISGLILVLVLVLVLGSPLA
ncbi:hypothetical protein PG994_012208 [Apiospora phragmitis]|uniref:DUF3309 domain-containing protein n=1 Tax=Apiospora phragmitis TaxID=2905665 RepID=A0ABR1TXL9_9PEZI